ncbi:MAG TPA: alpha/beta hydrolase [Actinomycetota bacterium]
MNYEEQRLTLSVDEGRILDVALTGPVGEQTLIFHGGTPSAPMTYEPFSRAAAERGIQLVQYARPGYCASTRQPARTVGDCAADVAAIADQLGAERILVAGWSGGGPHALATAALLPERVAAAATIAAVAPWDAKGLDWLGGMGKENVEEFAAALAGPEELQSWLEAWAPAMSVVTGAEVAESLGDLVADVDRAALTGEFAESLAAAFRGAVAEGIWGWFDDDLAFTREWGFALESIEVPLTLWQGGQDRMVPFAHGEWLAEHIPGAKASLLQEHGHLSIAAASFGEVLDDLLASAT